MSHKASQPVTRRDALCRIGNGFGMLAFASLVGDSLAAAATLGDQDPEDARLGWPAPSREGEARHLPVHERRAVAGGQLRSEADAGQVSRPAAARRQPRHRAQDRRADALAVHVQEVRPVRDGRQRAVPVRRRLRRRHLLHPLRLHRHPEPRAVDADDEHRPHAGRPAVARLLAHLRSRHARTRACPASSCSAPTCRPRSARRSGTTRSCRPCIRAPTFRAGPRSPIRSSARTSIRRSSFPTSTTRSSR